MRSRVACWAGAGLGLLAACSSGHDVAPVGSVGSPSRQGAGGAQGERVHSPSLGGLGGRDATSSRGGMGFGPPVTGPETPDEGSPLCDPDALWSQATELFELNTATEETLLALAPDETALVYRRDTEVFFAERAERDMVFQVEVLAWPTGYDPALGVALSPDSLTLVLVADESRGFGLLRREKLGESFTSEVHTEPFVVLNSLSNTAGVGLSHPLLARGGSELWWVESRQETSVWMASFNEMSVARGVQVGCGELGCDLMLEGLGGQAKIPSALSEDGRSLFLFDEYSGSELRYREQSAVDSGFFESNTLGERRDVHPSADCSRLYFTSAGDIYVEERLD